MPPLNHLSTPTCKRKEVISLITIINNDGKKVINSKFYKSIGVLMSLKGDIKSFNENIFAVHLCQKFDIVLHDDTQFYQYKDNYWQRITVFKVKKLFRDYFNSITKNEWDSVLENRYFSAFSMECRTSDELVSSENYINLKNGLFYFGVEWKFISHDKNIFSTSQLPIEYHENKKADYTIFKAFLFDILSEDSELVNVVQEVLGYCLCNHTKAQKLIILKGAGQNGKSVLCDVIRYLVGFENTSNISLKGFSNPFELANIVDKKANIATENELGGGSLQTEKLKMISAGDPIQINPKNEKPFSYKPYTKLIFAVNNMPKTLDISVGFKRRILPIPFNKQFYDKPQKPEQRQNDPEILSKLLQELDGIFLFALEGLSRLMKNGYRFSDSKAVSNTLKEYCATVDPYYDFIDTKINVNSNKRIQKTTVYNAFKQWAASQGFRHHANISARQFYADFDAAMQTQGNSYSEVKVRGNLHFKGLDLKDEF